METEAVQVLHIEKLQNREMNPNILETLRVRKKSILKNYLDSIERSVEILYRVLNDQRNDHLLEEGKASRARQYTTNSED